MYVRNATKTTDLIIFYFTKTQKINPKQAITKNMYNNQTLTAGFSNGTYNFICTAET